MRRAGLVGGLGPESTIDYYHRIVEAVPDAEIIINSIVIQKMIEYISNDRAAAADYLVRAIEQLARAGAGFAAITAITPHIVFDRVVPRSALPLISIVDAARNAARERGLQRLGLFATRFTMQARLYGDAITPAAAEQDVIHDKYMNELLKGTFRDATREQLLRIADRLIDEHHIDGLILGGTELPLLLRDKSYRGIPLLDTTAIHVEAIVRAIQS
ncbi:MAG TPA: amino acid racemase [Thermoanaerobaculia bacterium]